MSVIVVMHNEVRNRTAALKSRLNEGLLTQIESEYSYVVKTLEEGVGGATTANLIENMNNSRDKSVVAVQTLVSVIDFITEATNEIERTDSELANIAE